MTARACPEWPELMELAPDLQFKHYTVAEAQLPAEVLAGISHVSLGDVEICCDLERHVVNPRHTDAEVCAALRESHWFEVDEWSTSGPGTEVGQVDIDVPLEDENISDENIPDEHLPDENVPDENVPDAA